MALRVKRVLLSANLALPVHSLAEVAASPLQLSSRGTDSVEAMERRETASQVPILVTCTLNRGSRQLCLRSCTLLAQMAQVLKSKAGLAWFAVPAGL